MSSYLDALRRAEGRRQREGQWRDYDRRESEAAATRASFERAERIRRGREAERLKTDAVLTSYLDEMRERWITEALTHPDPAQREVARLRVTMLFELCDELQNRIDTMQMQEKADAEAVAYE
jgi:hypothetical protein